MFDEMQGEFNRSDYKTKDLVKLEATEYDHQAPANFYRKKLELPYGIVDVKVKYDLKIKQDD